MLVAGLGDAMGCNAAAFQPIFIFTFGSVEYSYSSVLDLGQICLRILMSLCHDSSSVFIRFMLRIGTVNPYWVIAESLCAQSIRGGPGFIHYNAIGRIGFVPIDIVGCPSQFCNCRSCCIRTRIVSILVLLCCS
ncbi:BnaCnng19330D [Brassica napus]|uniref:(rape) hypothetical protein n=1 Tax=Brassica napus TaxID=3708 RepID=A0A078ILZ8_BRANA|nr:unnamed protein product [Brassica napus]CDY50424.1 BnaCnng19330D [Brassica napus]